jgi:plasmid stabilization system protein ParE
VASDARGFIVRLAAEADIEQAALWYELRSVGLGADFLRAVDVCFEQIRRGPESFQQMYKSARGARTRRFPYVAYTF